MELLQLKYFKKVAETGKISTAAAALFISSPALSATISRLERELGAKLFDRHSNRIVLNENGEIFLRYVNQVFASLDSAKRELAEAAARRENEVHIGLVNGDIWREMLFYFTVAHPEIRLTTLSLGIGELQSLDLTGQTTFLFAMEGDVESSLWKAEALFEDRLKKPLAYGRSRFNIRVDEDNAAICYRSRDVDGMSSPWDDENIRVMQTSAGSGGQFFTLADIKKFANITRNVVYDGLYFETIKVYERRIKDE